jgi:hypothetical protein
MVLIIFSILDSPIGSNESTAMKKATSPTASPIRIKESGAPTHRLSIFLCSEPTGRPTPTKFIVSLNPVKSESKKRPNRR